MLYRLSYASSLHREIVYYNPRSHHDARHIRAPRQIRVGTRERTASAATQCEQSYRGRLRLGKWLVLRNREKMTQIDCSSAAQPPSALPALDGRGPDTRAGMASLLTSVFSIVGSDGASPSRRHFGFMSAATARRTFLARF
jgi:hypothetical protein